MVNNKESLMNEVTMMAWQTFHASGSLSTELAEHLNPVVLDSWKRCQQHINRSRVIPPTAAYLNSPPVIMDDEADLMTISLPYMEDIYQSSQEADCAVLIANHEGRILAMEGSLDMINLLNSLGVRIGEVMSEEVVGTNGVGLSIQTAMPIEVKGPEHYLADFHHFSTAAAPIYKNSEIYGFAGIVSLYQDSVDFGQALMISIAQAITNQLQTNVFLDEANAHLSEVRTVLETVTDGIIMWRSDRRVSHVNHHAAQMLHTERNLILGRDITDIITFPEGVLEAINHNIQLTDIEAKLQIERRIIRCFLTLHPIPSGAQDQVGYVAVMRPMSQVRRLVNQQLGAEALVTIDDILTCTPEVQSVLRQAETAARGSLPILLTGEAGVGKNTLARAIHNAGPRAEKPFLVLNCRAILHELMVKEILGFEGNESQPGRPSKFELADGGTLFLEEIEYLSLEVQALILRVIETRHIMRLGGTRAIPVNVRIIASTTGNLDQRANDQLFLPQLYYSLRVFRLELPPLRKRSQDILLLAEHYMARFSGDMNTEYALTDAARDILVRYPWPGNIRELQSVLERAVLNTAKDSIGLTDLPDHVRVGRTITPDLVEPQPIMPLEEIEREAIIRAGYAFNGNITTMAQALGISRTTIWRKMRHYDMVPEDFKAV